MRSNVLESPKEIKIRQQGQRAVHGQPKDAKDSGNLETRSTGDSLQPRMS